MLGPPSLRQRVGFLLCEDVAGALIWIAMKAKAPKTKAEVRFDPVLFAATVPARKPTAKDRRDVKEHENDPIEPKKYEDPGEMLDDP